MKVKDDSQMTKSAVDAVAEAVSRHAVAIITNNEAGEALRGVGSGVAIRWNGRQLILTARHVVRDTGRKDLRFFASPEGPMRTVSSEDLQKLPGVPTRDLKAFDPIVIKTGVMSAGEDLDLAWLEVGENGVPEDRLSFFDLDAHSTTPSVGQETLAIGYPSSIARQLNDNNWVIFSATEWTNILEPHEQPKFNAELHFLTTYHSAITDKLHPKGFSGAGMWFHEIGAKVWSPNLRLAGVITHFYGTSNFLKQTRVEKVIEFLKETAQS